MRRNSLWSDAWRRLKKNRMAVVCSVIFVLVVLFSLAGPLILDWGFGIDAVTQDMDAKMVPPSWEHPFGTDQLGRDMLARTMVGGRFAIGVAFTATFIALLIGISWGAIAAYAGGKTDEGMMRFVDVMYAFPTVVFVIVIQAVVSSKSVYVLFALIGSISWLTMARIVRGQVLSLRHRDFVEAARCIGASRERILFRHIVPNTLGPVIVYTTLSIPGVMLTEAFLSFLGLGVQAPQASWGTLVSEGAQQMVSAEWMLIFPGAIMALTIFSLNFLGDGLRDALDPQMRKD